MFGSQLDTALNMKDTVWWASFKILNTWPVKNESQFTSRTTLGWTRRVNQGYRWGRGVKRIASPEVFLQHLNNDCELVQAFSCTFSLESQVQDANENSNKKHLWFTFFLNRSCYGTLRQSWVLCFEHLPWYYGAQSGFWLASYLVCKKTGKKIILHAIDWYLARVSLILVVNKNLAS